MTFLHSTTGRVIANGINLGALAKSFKAEASAATADATPIDQGTTTPGRLFTLGTQSGMFEAEAFLDDTEDGVYAMLQRAFGADGIVIACPVGDTAGWPAIGFLAGTAKAAVVAGLNDNVGCSLSGESQGGIGLGVSLLPWLARTGAVNGSSVDAGASSARAFEAFLQVGEFAGTSCVVKVQHSANNSTWADAATFTTVAGSYAAQRVDIAAGTINRYRRAIIASGTFTSVELAVILAEK